MNYRNHQEEAIKGRQETGAYNFSGLGHQMQKRERSAEATKSALELCLMAAVENGTVKTGDITWKIMNQLIEDQASIAVDEDDRFRDRD